MAIKRYVPKPSTFKFDETLVGLRMADVNQFKKITELRAAYVTSLRAAAIEEKEQPTDLRIEGDISLLVPVMQYVASELCCDPTDAAVPWFAKDVEDQKTLKAQGIEKDLISDVPQAFLELAFRVFGLATQAGKTIDFAKIQDEAETESKKGDDAVPPSPL